MESVMDEICALFSGELKDKCTDLILIFAQDVFDMFTGKVPASQVRLWHVYS
jgi:hypothetical protein